MKTANILNIQRFCTKDGPGIRTTVFFKGCPLNCVWCHNPETQESKPQLMYNSEKCVHCLSCVVLCPEKCHTNINGKHIFNRSNCVGCGKCTSPMCEALEIAGCKMSVDEIIFEIMKDDLYYKNSDGGITLSGGEPLFQGEFCISLLKEIKKREIHTCVETCGFVSKSVLEQTLPLVDLYLFDWKESNPQKHLEYTGVSNQLILDNLNYLDSMQKNIILRCPIIPQINDRNDHLESIASIANNMHHLREIVIEPYHTLGVPKYEKLGKTYALPYIKDLPEERIQFCISTLKSLTDIPVTKA